MVINCILSDQSNKYFMSLWSECTTNGNRSVTTPSNLEVKCAIGAQRIEVLFTTGTKNK